MLILSCPGKQPEKQPENNGKLPVMLDKTAKRVK
jgi:hypothetical protein